MDVERFFLESFAFRVILVLVGLVVILLGLRMFQRPNAFRGAGKMTTEFKGATLTINGAAGTFLFVLGTVIIIAGLFKPLSFGWKRVSTDAQGNSYSDSGRGTAAVREPSDTDTMPVPKRDSGSGSAQ
jgi:hypothetical protein